MSNPRRHARQLAKALSRAAEEVRYSGKFDVMTSGIALQADRARSLCDLGFNGSPERATALLFCRELIEQLERAIDAIPDEPWHDYFLETFDLEITKARDHAGALREALEALPLFPPSFSTRIVDLLTSLIPERISAALNARAERAAESRARKQESEFVQAQKQVRAELAGGGVGFEVESAHRPGAPGQTCKRLVALAVCVLPADQRTRYTEEFRADLWELSRGRRLGYAVRLVVFSLSLRRNLLSSAAAATVKREHL